MSCQYSLLDEPLIRARCVGEQTHRYYSLPELFAAMRQDQIQDFPALRPHQRHPWHAFLVQLAAIALHRAQVSESFAEAAQWRQALLAITPDDPDGHAWCLVSRPEHPAFMQPPVPGEAVSEWTNHLLAPDELDMLVTSKNHDLKAARMVRSQPDDWIMALISLQTQDGAMGAPNKAISRVSSGYSCRPALGVVPTGNWGRRWLRDVGVLLEQRSEIIEKHGLNEDGIALLWTQPWDGSSALPFDTLDPFYIEICRRVRLVETEQEIIAYATGSQVQRIDAKQRKGITGDPWIPIFVDSEVSALNVGSRGFDYKLATELVFGTGNYRQPVAQVLRDDDGHEGIAILAQGVARGQGKTEGYHERRVPISPKVRKMLIRHQTDQVASIAGKRVKDIGAMRSLLWGAMATLFDNGNTSDRNSDSAKEKANRFARPFELGEDRRFFTELNAEIEASDPEQAYLDWLLSMVERAESILTQAFDAGPRNGEQRYRARAAALSRFWGILRSEKSPLPALRDHYHEQQQHKEMANVSNKP